MKSVKGVERTAVPQAFYDAFGEDEEVQP